MELNFHFDFISPYAYLGWTQIHALAERHGAIVRPRPLLFAGLLNHHGQKGPAEIPAKRIWVFKDTLRRARLLGVPLSPPPSHPFNPLLALRATLAAPAEAQRALVDALFAATWGDAEIRGVDRPEAVRAAAEEAGLDPDALLAQAQAPEIKAALRRGTERAIEAGVFGVPTVGVKDELFWGFDAFDLLERHLSGEDPLGPDMLDRFRDVPASASR